MLQPIEPIGKSDTIYTTWIIPVTLFTAIFLLTCTFSYSEGKETDDLDDTLQSWLDEGVCIYDDMRKIMNPEILPTDDKYYKEIKDHHLYFVEQLRERQEEAKAFYQASIIHTRQASYIPGKYHTYKAIIIHTRQVSYIQGKYYIYKASIIYTRLVSYIPSKHHIYQTSIMHTRQVSYIPGKY
jgi:hypothetical protein